MRDRGLASPDAEGERPHARSFDGVAQRECSTECCDGPPPDDCDLYRYFVRYTACGFGDPNQECAVNGPDIYLRCDQVCTGPFRINGVPELEGWCFGIAGGKYWTERCVDPPSGFDRLPCDAIVPEWDYPDGSVECLPGTDCDDPRCPGRAGYLIPTFCDSPCGPDDRNVVVCPPSGMDLTKCWYGRDVGNGSCGCMIIGPHSEKYEGPIGAVRVVYPDAAWKQARDPTTACCECCFGCPASPCEYELIDNSISNRADRYPRCYQDAPCSFGNCPDVVCCCGKLWNRTAVQYLRSNYRSKSFGNTQEIIREGWVLETKQYRAEANGTVSDLGCVSVSMNWRMRTWENGNLVASENGEVAGCNDPNYRERDGTDGCGDEEVSRLPTLSWIWGVGSPWSDWFPTGDFSQAIAAKRCDGAANPPQPDNDSQSFELVGSYQGSANCNRRSFAFDVRSRTTEKSSGNFIENEYIGRASVTTTILDHGDCHGGCDRKAPQGSSQSPTFAELLGLESVTAQDFLP